MVNNHIYNTTYFLLSTFILKNIKIRKIIDNSTNELNNIFIRRSLTIIFKKLSPNK